MSTSARARRTTRPAGKAAAPRKARRSGHASTTAAAASARRGRCRRACVYVSDDRPGIRRIRKGDGFVYRHADGKPVRNAADLERIRKLAIPPAYEDVWICTHPRGHLQATGRDARGRKQYRYHPEWRLARDADKFERMLEFGAALPRIRRRVTTDLAKPVARATDARDGPRDARAAARHDPRARRQRRIRAHQQFVRADDLAQSPCGGQRQHAEAALSRQERRDPRGRARGPARRQGRAALPGDAGPGPVPVRGRGRRHARGRLERCQRLHPRGERRLVHREGLPHLARHRACADPVGRADGRRCGEPAEREPGAGRGGAPPRQHGRGLQEGLCASARAAGARRQQRRSRPRPWRRSHRRARTACRHRSASCWRFSPRPSRSFLSDRPIDRASQICVKCGKALGLRALRSPTRCSKLFLPIGRI